MTVVAPIRKTITVPAPVERAFETFTAGMGRWWKPEYSVGAEPMATVVVEPRPGGRWYERGESGAECEWGKVLVWSPPRQVVLSWQIDGSWQYDPDLHTELDVRFTPEGRAATRVDLEHRGLEALGSAAEGIRAVFDAPDGWAGLVERMAVAAATDAVNAG